MSALASFTRVVAACALPIRSIMTAARQVARLSR